MKPTVIRIVDDDSDVCDSLSSKAGRSAFIPIRRNFLLGTS